WIWACVVPHPPIVVPEVGRGGEKEAESTIQAIWELEEYLEKPEMLVALSPHAPFAPGKMVFSTATMYRGSFDMFNAPSVFFEVPGENCDVSNLEKALTRSGISSEILHSSHGVLDHGCMVPLYFFRQFWSFSLPPLLLMNPVGLSPQNAYDAGRVLAEFFPEKKWGLLASGDLSHGLSPSSPGKYHPWGERFDQMVVECLGKGESLPLRNLSFEERRDAQECGLASVLFAQGLTKDQPFHILSYEAPFGVGYCVAYHVSKNFRLREDL
ncbi:MAG TPA: class III extradiol dioxygenase subunit B-like domain-containing protein, partial [Synergistaceae bacterium]|nr:class III extradiol dioxygenase subunit B-like domain-containing protein [Synergistaceae bacterium]